jgi:predicted RNA polymerase sigma factor
LLRVEVAHAFLVPEATMAQRLARVRFRLIALRVSRDHAR